MELHLRCYSVENCCAKQNATLVKVYIARDATIQFLEDFKANVSGRNMVGDRDLLRCIASTSLNTKLDQKLAHKITEAVVDAIQCIYPDIKGENQSRPIDLNMVEVMSMQRRMGTDSRFVNGLVLDHGGRHPDMPSILKNCHIMTCNVTFEYEKTEVQSGFFYSNAEEREKLVESERKWLDELYFYRGRIRIPLIRLQML